jgi:hypothetical protein
MPSALFYNMQTRLTWSRFKRSQGERFKPQGVQRTGTVLPGNEVSVAGQTYPFNPAGTGATVGQTLAVVNVGRPAAAVFAPADGSGLISVLGASGGGALTAHALNGPYHTGTLLPAQYPAALLADGSRALTGDLAVTSGVAIGEMEYIAEGLRVLAGLWAGRRTGAHVGLFRIPGASGPDTFILEATDHQGRPFLSIGMLDEPGNLLWARFGYEGQPAIELDADGQVTVDPDTFSRLLAPADIDMTALRTALGL